MSALFNGPTPNASGTLRGLVSLVAQTFAGVKTFTSALIASAGIQVASLWNTNGAGASDVGIAIGVSTADASVHATAKLAAIAAGIGGTYVEHAFFQKSGLTFWGAGTNAIKWDNGVAGNFWFMQGATNGNLGIGFNTSPWLTFRFSDAWLVAIAGLQVSGVAGISLGSGAATITHNGTGFSMPTRCVNGEYWQGTLFYQTGSGVALEAQTCARLSSDASDGASAVAASSESASAWSNATATLHLFKNGTNNQARIDKDGALQMNISGASRPAASAAMRGTVWYTKSAGGVADTLSVCLKSAADTYSWVTISTG